MKYNQIWKNYILISNISIDQSINLKKLSEKFFNCQQVLVFAFQI